MDNREEEVVVSALREVKVEMTLGIPVDNWATAEDVEWAIKAWLERNDQWLVLLRGSFTDIPERRYPR